MLSIGIAIALTLVGQDQSKSPAAKVLIEKMMNRYYSAQTLTGTRTPVSILLLPLS